jgi:hypothetical protein
MKIHALLIACVLAATSAGCQWRNRSAGEMVITADAPPTAPADAAAQSPAVTGDVTPPVVTPAIPTTAPKEIVTSAGPTTVTSTLVPPTTFVTPVYVAADADEATRLRNWPVSENLYASGHFIAGPVYRINAPPPRSDRISDIVAVELLQTPITAVQFVATPIWMLFTPPLTPVEYHGETNPPSYTVDDVLPFYPRTEKTPGTVNMQR